MIRINLLGKKKVAQVPFGLEEQLQKLGINPAEFQEMRPHLLRASVLLSGLYVVSMVPVYIHDEKLKALETQLTAVSAKTQVLQKELAAKKDIRKQMEQLNKEEVELQRQLNAVNALQRDRSQAFRVIDNIVVSLPAKVWLDEIKYDKTKVSIDGRSWEYFPINDFVKTITESTNYTSVVFKEIKAQDSAKPVQGVPAAVQKTKIFALDFQVKTPGE